MVKDLLIIADLGAAGNLVRNLLLLGATDWPLPADRFSRILNQYPRDLKLENWLEKEYQLRFWKQYYNMDLSEHLDCEKFRQLQNLPQPRVWLNHSAFWQDEQFNWFSKHCDVVYVAPATPAGLEWQIRSYVSKKTVCLLHDFCFDHDRDAQQQQYIAKHGHDAYYRLNITNMKFIIDQRQQEFYKHISPSQCIPLELLLKGTASNIQTALKQVSNLDIAVEQIEQVIVAWRHLHWNNTESWEYHEIFQQ